MNRRSTGTASSSTTTEFNASLDEVTFDGERLRVYVTALVDGCEWRSGKVTGRSAPRT
ncbi:hypothetical protein HDA32_006079 [Spinactinospora alkalitolerans]|uniref:Uncharacterized protein n=1 Tax=Spinactinospora alkalitolerans TaxID=687207 RepID=A0A852U440_9ACTN|nr:hypothetical protein [Spinactinospora alkalitolerans]